MLLCTMSCPWILGFELWLLCQNFEMVLGSTSTAIHNGRMFYRRLYSSVITLL